MLARMKFEENAIFTGSMNFTFHYDENRRKVINEVLVCSNSMENIINLNKGKGWVWVTLGVLYLSETQTVFMTVRGSDGHYWKRGIKIDRWQLKRFDD